jgi:hemerythrin-like domain-containing protein
LDISQEVAYYMSGDEDMPDTKKEVADLLRQHEAIRAHMKFLTRSLKKLTAQSHRGTAAELKERIMLYRWSLYDFREAVRRHIEMDERIFAMLGSDASVELDRGHEEIRGLIDEVIKLTEDATYNRLGRRDLNQSAGQIKDTIGVLCGTCQRHIAREDEILKPALQDL